MPDTSDRVTHGNPLRTIPGTRVEVLRKCRLDFYGCVSGLQGNEQWGGNVIKDQQQNCIVDERTSLLSEQHLGPFSPAAASSSKTSHCLHLHHE